jgi:hypothetical protein
MRTLLPSRFINEARENLSHKLGKSVTKPNIKMIPPEIYFQKSCGMFTNKVLTLRIKVKSITERPKEKITVNTRLLERVVSVMERPTMTGRSGRMHGAKIVSTPAINEIKRNVMLQFYHKKKSASPEFLRSRRSVVACGGRRDELVGPSCYVMRCVRCGT